MRVAPSATPPSQFAFLAVVPVTLVLMALGGIVAPNLIGAPGDAGVPRIRFFSGIGLSPEPLEQARYLLFLLCAPATVGASVLLARLLRNIRLPTYVILGISLVVELLGCLTVLSWWRTQQVNYSYFSASVLVAAAMTGLIAAAALFWSPVSSKTWSRRRWPSVLSIVLAAMVTAIALLPSLFHETNIAAAIMEVQFHLTFTMDEFAAVMNGKSPLVDLVPQYSNVLPYLLMPLLNTVGLSVGTFTTSMFALSMMAFLSVFYVFVRVSGRWTIGLLLYVPFLALSLYRTFSVENQHFYVANYFAVMPLRYFGPWLVAGLVVWQLRHPSRRRAISLFAAAAAVMINNPDFGIPSFVAALGATWLGAGRITLSSAASTRRVISGATVGLALAVTGTMMTSLLRTGELPDFGASLYFARQFALSGFYMLPMPNGGLHLVIGLTLTGALVRSIFRAVSPLHQDDQARLLTAALAYGSVFGLGASSYFVGRSHQHVLIAIFSAWAFVLALLMWDARTEVRQQERRDRTGRLLWAIPSVLIAGHLFLAVAPAWEMRDVGEQVARISAGGRPDLLRDREMVTFVRRRAEQSEEVLILAPLSHRIALQAGVRDVFPYNSPESVVSHEQLEEVRDRLETAGVRKVFTKGPLVPEMHNLLQDEGFRRTASRSDDSSAVLWERR